MPKLTIEIDAESAAFDGGMATEINRILKRVGLRICAGETSGKCMDLNGNSCGRWEVSDESGIPDIEETRRGELIAEILGLRRKVHDGEKDARYSTTWGSKTARGLFRTLARLIAEGK